MENENNTLIQNLEAELKQTKLNKYILEEENSLLREATENLLIENERIKQEYIELEKQREEINKMKSGNIYKILVKTKKIIKK